MPDFIQTNFDDHQATLAATRAIFPRIQDAAEAIRAALEAGGKVLVFGNGGSAADAQHFAAELLGRYQKDRRGLPAIALTTDTSALTAIGNDYGFDAVFSRQIAGLAKPGDVAVGITTSGNSKNVVAGLIEARNRGADTIALVGGDGGTCKAEARHAIVVPSKVTARIQEMHILIIHTICEYVETWAAGT